jgi:hypothetical protein
MVDNQLPGFMSAKGVWPRQLQTMVGGPGLTSLPVPHTCPLCARWTAGLGSADWLCWW